MSSYIRFVLGQHSKLDFYSARSTRTHYSQPVSALTPSCCVFSEEALQTILSVFGLNLPGLELTTYHSVCGHASNYTTVTVCGNIGHSRHNL